MPRCLKKNVYAKASSKEAKAFLHGCTMYLASLASKIRCTSKLRNTLRKFEALFEISKHFLRNFANLLELSFEVSLEHSHTISKFRKCQDNSAFENSSKVWRYFVALKKSLVFVEKWRNVSKFVEIRSHYFCTVLYVYKSAKKKKTQKNKKDKKKVVLKLKARILFLICSFICFPIPYFGKGLSRVSNCCSWRFLGVA